MGTESARGDPYNQSNGCCLRISFPLPLGWGELIELNSDWAKSFEAPVVTRATAGVDIKSITIDKCTIKTYWGDHFHLDLITISSYEALEIFLIYGEKNRIRRENFYKLKTLFGGYFMKKTAKYSWFQEKSRKKLIIPTPLGGKQYLEKLKVVHAQEKSVHPYATEST
ncbi:hypothetical protein TNCV_1499711 [Trichonephila clavipes]|nr:hypothetical protein TNCV_1499711 [Trichonephila clavipes]